MLIVSNFLLWVVVLLQLVAIAALARRVRMVPERGTAALQLVHDAAAEPRTGEAASGGAGESGAQAAMILQISAGCPVGQRLIPDAELMARTAGLRFQLARALPASAGGPAAGQTRGRGAGRLVKLKDAGQVPPPQIMLTDAVGDVLVQGTVKSRADLARLLARMSGERSPIASARS